MAYTVPQIDVYQNLSISPAAPDNWANVHVSGGHAELIRYDESGEKENGFLGYYDELTNKTFAWPNLPSGANPDLSYTKVYLEKALLRYAQHSRSSSIATTKAGRQDIIEFNRTITTANGYTHHSDYGTRGVKIGDIIKVVGDPGSGDVTHWSYVAGFIADKVASSVGAGTSDANNAPDQSTPPSATNSYIGDPNEVNCVVISSVDQTNFKGWKLGLVSETYTIEVIQASTGNDATTARLKVTSASGLDDQPSITPSAFGSPTPIGTLGATVTWQNTDDLVCSSGVSDPQNFRLGQKWSVTVYQTYTKVTPTSGGTYTGSVDATYIIEVVEGGDYSADTPKIQVTSDVGHDGGGPVAVTAANTPVAVGTQGVTVQFDGNGLVKGDKFYIAVTAEKDGQVKTLILGHPLPSSLYQSDTAVDVDLHIQDNVEFPTNNPQVSGQNNWDQDLVNGITTYAGAYIYHSDWGGNLPLIGESNQGYSKLYAHVRYWRKDLTGSLGSVYDIGQLDSVISGPLHPDNPLKWGVYKALSNSNNNTTIYFTAVCPPDDLNAWLDVLELLDGEERVYHLVPLTEDTNVLGQFSAHLENQSGNPINIPRLLWYSLNVSRDKDLVASSTSTDGNEVLATLADDPNTSGTQYTYLTITSGNADLQTAGVQAGDKVRYLFGFDSYGNETWSEFTVKTVVNSTTVVLEEAHTSVVTTPQKVEIYRHLDLNEYADHIPTQYTFKGRRYRLVWPGEVGSGGLKYPGFHLAAALAGLAASVYPHQPLTNVEVNGFDDVSGATQFNRTQLDKIAGGGIWIVTQDKDTGTVYNRHAITGGNVDDVNDSQDSITRNLDDISVQLKTVAKEFLGKGTTAPEVLDDLETNIRNKLKHLAEISYPNIGPQVISYESLSVEQDSVFTNKVNITVDGLDIPEAIDKIDLTINVG